MYSTRSRTTENGVTGKTFGTTHTRKAGAKRTFGKNLLNNTTATNNDKKKQSTFGKVPSRAKGFGGASKASGVSKQRNYLLAPRSSASDPMAIDSHASVAGGQAKKQRKLAPSSGRLAMPVEPAMEPVSQPQRAVAAVPQLDYEDIDVYDEDDAQCCTEYIHEIFAYLRAKETSEQVDAQYMSAQSDLTPKMRAILIDWMVDVHIKFKLLSETMFLSVNIIDRFLGMKEVSRHKLQLVGITAMLIASKYEEIYSPEVRDFVYICDKAFSKDEILALEIQMLNMLNFSLTPATPLHFLRRFSKAARSDSTTHTLSKYLIELSLPEYNMLVFKPSTIASAAVYIARVMRDLTPYWNDTLHHYTQHSVDDLRECAETLNAALVRSATSNLKATRRKYSFSKLLAVARIEPVQVLPF